MTERHEDIAGLAAGYALDALDPEDRQRFREHLRTCAECQQEVTALRGVAGSLPLAVEEHDPPPHLRERVLSRARSEAAARRRKPDTGRLAALAHAVRSPVAAAAAFVLLLAATAGLAYWNMQLQERIEGAESRLEHTRSAMRIMAIAEQRWEFQGTPEAPDVRGVLAYSSEQGQGSVYILGLAPDPEGTYNAWTLKDGERARAGGIWEMDAGHWLTFSEDPASIDGFGLTLRPIDPDAQPVDLVDMRLSRG